MLGEIAGVGIHQSKSKKGLKSDEVDNAGKYVLKSHRYAGMMKLVDM